MQTRFIPAAAFGESCANGKMDRASYLFVEEHIFAKALDAIICADTPFAKDARARICVEQRSKILLIFCGSLFDHFAIFEPQLNIYHFLALINGRILEAYPAIC